MSGLKQRAIHASFISTLANNINVPISSMEPSLAKAACSSLIVFATSLYLIGFYLGYPS
jgi:hypothetical protein